MQAGDPGFNPSRPVEPAYVRLPPDVESGTLIEEPAPAQIADLCNGLYEVILQVLARYYGHGDETQPEHPGRTAGPTLEIARPAAFALPHRQAAWSIVNERLVALADSTAALAQQPSLGVLTDLAAKLRAMSGDIRAHLDERATDSGKG